MGAFILRYAAKKENTRWGKITSALSPSFFLFWGKVKHWLLSRKQMGLGGIICKSICLSDAFLLLLLPLLLFFVWFTFSCIHIYISLLYLCFSRILCDEHTVTETDDVLSVAFRNIIWFKSDWMDVSDCLVFETLNTFRGTCLCSHYCRSILLEFLSWQWYSGVLILFLLYKDNLNSPLSLACLLHRSNLRHISIGKDLLQLGEVKSFMRFS